MNSYLHQIFFLLVPNPLPSDNKKLPCELNAIPYPDYLYSSKSAFLVNLTAPNKEFANIKLALCANGHKFISYKI